MSQIKDLTNREFGRLIVKYRVESKNGRAQWFCECKCGKTTIAAGKYIISGQTRSCGCLHLEKIAKGNPKHGMNRTPEHIAWKRMKARCYNIKGPDFADYGARGIVVCDGWLHSFANFYANVGPRPSPQHSIDRINNNGNYEPGNVRWATSTQQARNKRNNHHITFNNETLTIPEWAEKLNVPYARLVMRFYKGWPEDLALTLPKGAILKDYLASL